MTDVTKKATMTIDLPSAQTDGWLNVCLRLDGVEFKFAHRPQTGGVHMQQGPVELRVNGADRVPDPAAKPDPVPLYAKPALKALVVGQRPTAPASKTAPPKTAPPKAAAPAVPAAPGTDASWMHKPSPLRTLTHRAFQNPGESLNGVAKILCFVSNPNKRGFTAKEILPLVHVLGANTRKQTTFGTSLCDVTESDVRNKLYTLHTRGVIEQSCEDEPGKRQVVRYKWVGESNMDWLENETPAQLTTRLTALWPDLRAVQSAKSDSTGFLSRDSLLAIIRRYTAMLPHHGAEYFVSHGFVRRNGPNFTVLK